MSLKISFAPFLLIKSKINLLIENFQFKGRKANDTRFIHATDEMSGGSNFRSKLLERWYKLHAPELEFKRRTSRFK